MNIEGLHIELTNRCYLKCPLCSRTQFLKDFKQKNWDKKDLNLLNLQKFLDIDLNGMYIILIGNYGDPIYHPKFFKFIKYFKEQNSKIVITTNGSYKNKKWWEELVSLLTEDDVIKFAIDGTDKTFTNYRINGDWQTIEQGLTVVGNSKVQSVWQFIPFVFNEQDVETTKKLSEHYNIKKFDIRKSNRFDTSSVLAPVSSKYMSEKVIKRINVKQNISVDVDPACSNKRSHYISASGFYTPCCHLAEHNFYYKSPYYQNRNDYDITKTKLSAVLDKETDFFDKFLNDKPKVCQYNCPKV